MADPDAPCTSQAGDDLLRPYISLDAPRLVLDLRPDAAFHREHLVESYHIAPVSELKSRYSYLPPRNVSFLVLADALQRDDVIEAFATISSARIVLLCDGDVRDQGAAPPGGVQLRSSSSFFDSARQLGLVRSSTGHQQRIAADDKQDVPALLFRPSNAVRRTVLQLEAKPQVDSSPRRVLDLGCGAARDLAWILHGSRTRNAAASSRVAWTGVAIDNWKAALRRGEQLMDDLHLDPSASQPQPATQSSPICEKLLWAKCTDLGELEPLVGTGKGRSIRSAAEDADLWNEYVQVGLGPLLPSGDGIDKDNPQAQFDLILCVRFHPRALLPRLDRLVRPGGVILLSHFVTLSDAERDVAMQAHPHATLDYDSPPHEGRIQPGEAEALVDAWNRLADSPYTWTVAESVLEPIEDGRIIKSLALCKTRRASA